MLDKLTDRVSKRFSKKTVENTKEAIVEDVKQNRVGYTMSAITGLVIATAVVIVVKTAIGGPPVSAISYTYNFYLNSAEQIPELISKVPTPRM